MAGPESYLPATCEPDVEGVPMPARDSLALYLPGGAVAADEHTLVMEG